MTLYELASYVDGHNQAHGGESEMSPPDEETFARLVAQSPTLKAARR